MTPTRQEPGHLAVHGIRTAETAYLYREIFEERIYLPAGGFRLGAAPVVFEAYREVAATLDLVLAARFRPERVTCRVVTLAWLARHLGLLKLDVEGCEVDALLGLDGDTWPAVRNAVLEVTDESGELARVWVLLEGQGLATEARQLPDYAGTRQHIVYARRD